MLAGRKLLLADDSITIQKVVDLTFADEGVNVLCVNNGRDAIDRIEEFAPDVVLADVFMPQMNGYEVCEHIKQNEKLKHIPVMLLVGSFEPFDEAEARRVGADDTLTKPFQSIRRLIDKVGSLVSGQPDGEAPTAELPKSEVTPEPEQLSEEEIEITTADTQPLRLELGHDTKEWALPISVQEAAVRPTPDTKVDERKMESNATETAGNVFQDYPVEGDLVLDIGEYETGPGASGDEFLLDIDIYEAPQSAPVENEFAGDGLAGEAAAIWNDSSHLQVVDKPPAPTPAQLATTQEFQRPDSEASPEPAFEKTLSDDLVVAEKAKPPVGEVFEVSLERLSPEMIDAIARRAVEHLSEKVVQEIAWEVVPQLAELLIKRQLEEKNS